MAGLPVYLDFLPNSADVWQAGRMLANVAVVVYDGVAPFELGVLCEAWGVDRSDQGIPSFEFAVCAHRPGPVSTTLAGFALDVVEGLDRLDDAELICVPAMPRDRPPPPEVVAALQAAHRRGARLLSVCTGAFVLGAAGLLDGRRCTTHWRYVDELAERLPLADVECDVLYVDDGSIVTSAGSAAGLDACLHVMRQEFGAGMAAAVARRMVVASHRDGGQAQFIQSPVPETTADTLQPLLEWMSANLCEEITVDSLATRAMMAPRTFARRFKAETGTTPYHWLTNQRVLLAERMLEESDETIERIATQVGFGNATAFRHHFARLRGTSPQRYRRLFRAPVDGVRAS
jgi:transcriptional regulator GlxA family with amidase domain